MTRSENMSRIRSKDTAPEIALRKRLHADGWRYRCNVARLPGKPDIVFISARVAVFVHGCFWHKHPGCRRATRPGSNRSYWDAKLQGNVERDRKHAAVLRKDGWRVLVVWECQTRAGKIARAVRSIESALAKRGL